MKNISFHTKLLVFLAIHICLFSYSVIFHWSWTLVIICFILSKIIGNLGNEIGLHRLWTHKSFRTSKWKEIFLHFMSVPLLSGSSIVYAGVHRQHHAYSDTENDPHDTKSIIRLFFYIRKNKKFNFETKFVTDLLKDPIHRWIHKNYFKINFLILLMFLLLLGPVNTGYFLSFIIVHCFIITGLVNYLGHNPKLGNQKHLTTDMSTNNYILQLLTFYNHGLHNNHHKFPGSFTNAFDENEIDPLGWVIKKFFMFSEKI